SDLLGYAGERRSFLLDYLGPQLPPFSPEDREQSLPGQVKIALVHGGSSPSDGDVQLGARLQELGASVQLFGPKENPSLPEWLGTGLMLISRGGTPPEGAECLPTVFWNPDLLKVAFPLAKGMQLSIFESVQTAQPEHPVAFGLTQWPIAYFTESKRALL